MPVPVPLTIDSINALFSPHASVLTPSGGHLPPSLSWRVEPAVQLTKDRSDASDVHAKGMYLERGFPCIHVYQSIRYLFV